MDPSKEHMAADQDDQSSEKDNASGEREQPAPAPSQSAAPPKPKETEAALNPELDSPSDFLNEADPKELSQSAAQPLSQAALDLARGLAPEEERPMEKHKKPAPSSRPPLPGRPPAFRWFLLLILSLVGLFAWALEAHLSQRPFHWPAWGFMAVGLLIGVLPFRFFPRLPTRAGLTTFIWALSFYLSALYGPPEVIFKWVPAALCWAGLLTLITLWLLFQVWRKLKKVKPAALILTLIIAYAALGPLWALISRLALGYPLSLNFASLALSPAFITGSLDWLYWPLSVTIALILPLSALFALWDQVSVLRRPGRRHGGNFFLALAFLALIPYGFLSFGPAVAARQSWSDGLRSIYPPALEHLQTLAPTTPAELLNPTADSTPSTVVEPDGGPSATTSEEAAAAPAEQPPLAAPPLPGPAVPNLEQRLTAAEEQLSRTNEKLDQLEKKVQELFDSLHQPTPPAQETAPEAEAPSPPIFSNPFNQPLPDSLQADPETDERFQDLFNQPLPDSLNPEPPLIPDYQTESTSQHAPVRSLRLEPAFLSC